MKDSWILIGGTGQDFGLTAATLAMLGVVPLPRQVLVVDADQKGKLFDDLRSTLDIARYERFLGDSPRDELERITPSRPVDDAKKLTLNAMYAPDAHLAALYSRARREMETRDGFKAEPQIGSASFFGPAFDPDSDFYRTLANLDNATGEKLWIVGSVAGGTGAGLWQLIVRLARKLAPKTEIRLMLLGPLMSIGATAETDANGMPLTDARLDANAAAGFRTALASAKKADAPFDKLFLLGYPDSMVRPAAPSDRTARRTSRMTLAAATALTVRDIVTPAGSVLLLADDTGEVSSMPGLRFSLENGGSLPVASIGALVGQTLKLMRSLAGMRLTAAASPLSMFMVKSLSAPVEGVWRKSKRPMKELQDAIRSQLAPAIGLLEEFERWLGDGADRYPAKIGSVPKGQLAPVKSWQDALDAFNLDTVDPTNFDYHVRRWIGQLGAAQLSNIDSREAKAKRPPSWLMSADVTPTASDAGWSPVPAAQIFSPLAYHAGSFPTPFGQAHWHLQNLEIEEPSRAEKRLIHESETLGHALWRGLVGGVLEVVNETLYPPNPTEGARNTAIRDVCAFIEDEHFAPNRAGEVALPFLALTRSLGGVQAGTLVGALHPLAGPFLGDDFEQLAGHIDQELGRSRAHVDGVLAWWRQTVEELLRSARHRRPKWLRTLPDAGSTTDPRTLNTIAHPIQLDWPAGSPPPLPTVGAERRLQVLRLVTRNTDGERLMPSCLPVHTAGEAQPFLEAPDSVGLEFSPPSTTGDGLLQFEAGTLPSWAHLSFSTGFVDLHDWTISVWPGEKAPKDWRGFGVCIEPNQRNVLKDYNIVVYVESEDGKRLVRRDITNELSGLGASDDFALQTWIEGRPRLLSLQNEDGAIGFFPLLGQAKSRRSGSGRTLQIALDFGTSRTCAAVRMTGLEAGVFEPQDKVVFEPFDPGANPYRGDGLDSVWHPLRYLEEGGGLRDFEAPENTRVVLLPSTLLRRRAASDLQRRHEPFYATGIPGTRMQAEFDAFTNLKWAESQDDQEHYLYYALLTAIAEADAHGAPANTVDLRISYPRAFGFRQRGNLEAAVRYAAKHLTKTTGIKAVSESFLDEAMAVVYASSLRGDLRLVVDIGGGSTDIVVLRGGEVLATDSIRLGADLILDAYCSRMGRTMAKLRLNLIESREFEGFFNRQAPAGSRQIVDLVSTYATRVLASALYWRQSDETDVLSEPKWWKSATNSLPKGNQPVQIPVFLAGGGWRLGGLAHEINWNDSDECRRRVHETIGASFRDNLEHLMLDLHESAGFAPTPQLDVEVNFERLVNPGGEKAIVALGLLDGHARLKPSMPQLSGISTCNGLDENFEGQSRRWFEWINKDVEWRKGNDIRTDETLSDVKPTPELIKPRLGWSLDEVLKSSTTRESLARALTPMGQPESIYKDNQYRTRSALSRVMEGVYAPKLRKL